jgi:glutamate carboxypeptidase
MRGSALLEAVERDRERLFELLDELVAIPTHVTQPFGLARVGERLVTELEGTGFSRQDLGAALQSQRPPAWAELVLSPDVGYDGLHEPMLLTRPGELEGELLILGDLDSALPHEPSQCRLTIRDGRAIGPAVADMKGGLTLLVGALRALVTVGERVPTITVLLSCDEQAGSIRSAPAIRARAARASWVLCVECAREGGRVMRSRAHIGIGLLAATGLEAHAGTARDQGVNAISLLARALVALDGPGVTTPDGTVTPTILHAGRRRSVVPGSAEAVLDVRARDATAWEALAARIGDAVRIDDRISVEFFSHRPGLPATDRTSWILGLVEEAGRDVGLQIESVDSMAAGSSAFVDSATVPVLDGMGPAGGALMTPDEYIEVESLPTRAALLARTIQLLGAAPRD